MLILGIETSCDDTAASVVDTSNNKIQVLSNIRKSQGQHQKYGGVVPEIAGRVHQKNIFSVVKEALTEAKKDWNDIDAIACTQTPGLQAALLVGTSTASFLSLLHNKPLISIDHIFGHISSCSLDRVTADIKLPALVLTVSGGHTSMYLWEEGTRTQLLGKTLDDAAGEAFDKTARMLGLGYPGGPNVEIRAKNGNPKGFDLPYIYLSKESLDFSFSGLKSAISRITQAETLSNSQIDDLCASFQHVMSRILTTKVQRALDKYPQVKQFHFVGGVSANQQIRTELETLCQKKKIDMLTVKSLSYCTDNAAMIAGSAYWYLQENPNIAQIKFLNPQAKHISNN